LDTSIVIKELLDASEIEWLNSYNAKVFQTLSPRLPSEIAQWLRNKTLPI
jgi:Xaa-Pro aminopeptidase